MRPVVHSLCPVCGVVMNKRNISKHIERRHSKTPRVEPRLQSECVDEANGIYSVQKFFRGHSIPLHVQSKTTSTGERQRVRCESRECQVNMRSGLMPDGCVHLRAVPSCSLTAPACALLRDDSLAEMVQNNGFGEEIRDQCLRYQSLAREERIPLSVHLTVGLPEFKKALSVFEPTFSLGRVTVVYNTRLNSWNCTCKKSKRTTCQHVPIAQWHLYQEMPELFRSVTIRATGEHERAVLESAIQAIDAPAWSPLSTDGVEVEVEEEEEACPMFPATSDGLTRMLAYILKHKKLIVA